MQTVAKWYKGIGDNKFAGLVKKTIRGKLFWLVPIFLA
jgi:hypothetical protein